MNKLQPNSCGGGRFLSLVALAIILLGFVEPAHADSISIDLDTTAVTLQRSGNLYKHNSSVRVHNSNTHGFTLSINADQPNLVNDKDSTYKIDSVSGTNQHLAANQWGYGMGKDAATFNSVSSATLADVTSDSKGNCTSVDDCTLHLTFGASLDPKHLPTGSYSTSLTYTATSKPAPYVPPTLVPEPPAPAPYIPPKPKWTTNGCVPNDYTNCTIFDPQYFGGLDAAEVEWRDGAWYTIPNNNETDNEKWFNYDIYNTRWAHFAVLTHNEYYDNFLNHHMDYSSNKELPVRLNMGGIKSIMVAVPRYVVQGNSIIFCQGDVTSSDGGDRCGDSKVSLAFREHDGLGGGPRDALWVSASAIGCKNAPRESLCTENDSDLDGRCLDIPISDYVYFVKDRKENNFLEDEKYRKEYDAAMKDANLLAEALGSPCY